MKYLKTGSSSYLRNQIPTQQWVLTFNHLHVCTYGVVTYCPTSFQSLSLQDTLARWNRTSSLLRFIHTQVILGIHLTDGALGGSWFILELGPISNGGKWSSNPILCAVGKSQAINSRACCNPNLSHKETTWVDWKFSVKEATALPTGFPSPLLGSCWQQRPAPKGFSLFPKDLKFNLYWKKPIRLWTLDPLLFICLSISLYFLCSAHQDIAREAYNWERYIPNAVFLLLWTFFRNVKKGVFGVSNQHILKIEIYFLNSHILHQVPRQVTNYIEGCFILVILTCIWLNYHLMDDYHTLHHKIGKEPHTHL
jgi:hypothetical protein